MSRPDPIRVLVLSVVKHDYVARGVASHPGFELAVVADDADQPDWVHERNDEFAREHGIPYVRDVEEAIAEHDVQVAVVSSEAERHCDLSVRAAAAGLHAIHDKPMSNSVPKCDPGGGRGGAKQGQVPDVEQETASDAGEGKKVIDRGDIVTPYAIHGDFYFAKDAGPPQGSLGPDAEPLDWLKFLKASTPPELMEALARSPWGSSALKTAIHGLPLALMR